MQFKNMKIEINDQQPLDEVVRELERLGYKDCRLNHNYATEAATFDDGYYQLLSKIKTYATTTLAELKEMK